jgi:mannose-6-phosphate isomerase-like protein (cupin superfamily)
MCGAIRIGGTQFPVSLRGRGEESDGCFGDWPTSKLLQGEIANEEFFCLLDRHPVGWLLCPGESAHATSTTAVSVQVERAASRPVFARRRHATGDTAIAACGAVTNDNSKHAVYVLPHGNAYPTESERDSAISDNNAAPGAQVGKTARIPLGRRRRNDILGIIKMKEETMTNKPWSFVHNLASEARWTPGLREIFEYRDLGIKDGTAGDYVAHLIRHNGKKTKDEVQQWHVHDCTFQLVYVINGWATFAYENEGQRTIHKGDCILQLPGIKHREIACSEDFEVLEIVSPANFATRIVEAPQAEAQAAE